MGVKFIMSMQKIFLEKFRTWVKIDGYFIFLWIVFVFTIAFALTMQYIVYRSEITVAVISKNEKTVAVSGEVAGNLAELTKTLFFYEKLLSDNPALTDEWANYSSDKKKEKWNRKIETVRQNESTIFVIRITDRSQSRANSLVRQSVKGLFNLSGKYYDIKNDIDLRILDGPIEKVILRGWHWIAIASLVLGFFLSWLVQLFFSFIERLFSTKSKSKFSSIKFPKIKKTSGGKKEDLEKLIDNYAEKDNAFFAPKIKTEFRKSNPPMNLPIASSVEEDDIQVNQQEIEILAVEKEQIGLERIKKENTSEVISEPTENEFKKRLNQLLKGDL
jgi:capsular polysaccharide biosynthesis protein